jgi:hypothetical protein
MDDKDRETLGGGALGGALGFAVGGPPGAAVGSVVGSVLARQESGRDATLRRAYYAARDATGDAARLYVDGIDPDGAQPLPPPDVLEDADADPDMVVIDSAAGNLVVAVATLARTERDSDALVATLGDLHVEAVGEWARVRSETGAIEGPLTVTSPEGLGDEFEK